MTRWQPSSNDKQPACKAAAVRHVETAGNGSDRAVQVIDAQYGGLLTDTASVLVVTRAWRRSSTGVQAGGRTYDVRLSRHGATWRVDAVFPSRPGRRRQHFPQWHGVCSPATGSTCHRPPAATCSPVRCTRAC